VDGKQPDASGWASPVIRSPGVNAETADQHRRKFAEVAAPAQRVGAPAGVCGRERALPPCHPITMPAAKRRSKHILQRTVKVGRAAPVGCEGPGRAPRAWGHVAVHLQPVGRHGPSLRDPPPQPRAPHRRSLKQDGGARRRNDRPGRNSFAEARISGRISASRTGAIMQTNRRRTSPRPTPAARPSSVPSSTRVVNAAAGGVRCARARAIILPARSRKLQPQRPGRPACGGVKSIAASDISTRSPGFSASIRCAGGRDQRLHEVVALAHGFIPVGRRWRSMRAAVCSCAVCVNRTVSFPFTSSTV